MSGSTDELITTWHMEHRARLERILTHRTGDPELAADAVSEAFVRLHERLQSGFVPDDAAAWLTHVALNIAASEGRHRKVVQRVTPRLSPPRPMPAPEDEVIGRDLLRRVAAALTAMPASDRSIVLAAAGGASSAALGAASGCTVGGARVRLCRARGRLRDAVPELR